MGKKDRNAIYDLEQIVFELRRRILTFEKNYKTAMSFVPQIDDEPAPEKLPKWVRYLNSVKKVIKRVDCNYELAGVGPYIYVGDCTHVHVIPEEKWMKLEEAFKGWEPAGADDDYALNSAIKQLMEEEV
jgi:hypothetical protein